MFSLVTLCIPYLIRNPLYIALHFFFRKET